MRYQFTGDAEEVFPALPINRTLRPGEVVDTDTPVEHARLRLVDDVPSDVAEAAEDSSRKTARSRAKE